MAMDFTKSNNAKNLQKIQQKGVEESNTAKALDIRIDLIDKNPDNALVFEMSDIDILAENIEEIGLLTPLNVYLKDDGRYEIASGHRRYEALKKLGRTVAKCYVSAYPDSPIDVAKNLIDSNIQTRKMTPLDMARALNYYSDILKKEKVKGDKRALVAKHFKISSSQVQKYTCLLQMIPELQSLANQPTFPFSALNGAVTLCAADQMKLYKKLLLFKEMADEEDGEDEEDKEEISLNRTKIRQLIINMKAEAELKKSQPKETKINSESQFISKDNLINDTSGDYNENDVITITDDDFKPNLSSKKPKNTPLSDDIIITTDDNAEITLSDNDISIATQEEINTIDDKILVLKMELEAMLREEIAIKDKAKVKKYIEGIKEDMDKIEQYL